MPVQALILTYHNPDGGPVVVPGSVSFTTPGTFSFTVPLYNTLTADVPGAGGGGCGTDQYGFGNSEFRATQGQNGGASSFGSVTGNGGQGGQFTGLDNGIGADGAAGTASGGDTNTTGGGAAGGLHSIVTTGNGGNGGRAVKTYAAGQLAVGGTVTVVVGAGGAGGEGNGPHGNPGANGSVSVSWA
ncbi:hypothetical protein [Bradyrhizobium sp. Leo121]|uniref:hypothetical protein n=1 Tax=Bradyrhizobium sp. Leo121 TaxID=1571195 RepID=UPI00102995F2|nr:hypothetical protein [Bradyrhizobium sp. Leo121]RZN21934.1 hypothetical protein CWO90_32480 [Bradyrhizobium sp. Leo121]